MKKHLLLIDDDPDELIFFEETQEMMPGAFTYSYLSRPKDACKTVASLQPDIVFIDFNMPILNGLDCIASLKKEEDCQKIPVILYSTAIDSVINSKALALGAARCIQKPVCISVFVEMLQEVLRDVERLHELKN